MDRIGSPEAAKVTAAAQSMARFYQLLLKAEVAPLFFVGFREDRPEQMVILGPPELDRAAVAMLLRDCLERLEGNQVAEPLENQSPRPLLLLL